MNNATGCTGCDELRRKLQASTAAELRALASTPAGMALNGWVSIEYHQNIRDAYEKTLQTIRDTLATVRTAHEVTKKDRDGWKEKYEELNGFIQLRDL